MNSLRHISFFANKILANKPLFPLALAMANEFSTSSLNVEHDVNESRFFVKLGTETAFLSYTEDPPGVFDLEHTWVPTTLRGKGIAEKLAQEAFDYIAKNNKKMILTCTYLVHFEKKMANPEYKQYIISR